ncbi:MAG: histidine phosphatase family protein, partial [Micromonosporaceae bacterium]
VAAADPAPRLISSPLTRARQTAEEIAALIRVKVDIEPGLAECDFGEWEGLTFQEVRDRWPDELEAWLGSTSVRPPSGESMDDVAARVLPVAAQLRNSHEAATLVAVSHVTGIKLLLRDALDGGGGFLHQLHLDPGGISIVDSWPDGGVSVRLVNDVSHLGEMVT